MQIEAEIVFMTMREYDADEIGRERILLKAKSLEAAKKELKDLPLKYKEDTWIELFVDGKKRPEKYFF